MSHKDIFVYFLLSDQYFANFSAFFHTICLHWRVPRERCGQVFNELLDKFYKEMPFRPVHFEDFPSYHIVDPRDAETVYNMINEYMEEEIFYYCTDEEEI